MFQSLAWGPIAGSDKGCIVTAVGVRGEIVSNSCPASLKSGQTANITTTCKNIGTASGTFALLFCASSPPYTECDVKQYVSEGFELGSGTTKDFTIPIIMPNNQIIYVASLQHAEASEWVTDDTVQCSISLPVSPPSSPAVAVSQVSGVGMGLLLATISVGIISAKKKPKLGKAIVIGGITVAGITLLIQQVARKSAPAPPPVSPLTPILSGTYKSYGNIYSPEISGSDMYFGGWYSDADYPDDAIYVTDLNNLSNVKKVIQIPGKQVNDPSIIGNKMYMTHSPDPSDLTQQYIAVSTTNNNGITWSTPSQIIPHAWLPSTIQTDKLYIYYTSSYSTELLRAEINIYNQIIETKSVIFEESGFYPINIDVKYNDGIYYLMGDYWYNDGHNNIYSIGLWTSLDGINFTAYKNNPIIMPDGDNIIARTPNFSISGNVLKIYFAQQKLDWWTNAIYIKNYIIS